MEKKTDGSFYDRVLGSFEEEPYTAEEVIHKQKRWQKFNFIDRGTPKYHDFPDYFYAGFWTRLCAFLVDLICIGAIQNILLNTIFNLTGWQKQDGLFTVYGFLSVVIYLAYFILLTKMNNGQTIGKMIFGIQVVSFDEPELSWETVLVREGACRFILKSPWLMLGYLPTAFSKRKQHAGDFVCNTSVVTLSMIRAFNQQRNG